jgi:hypothetical protein
MKTLPHEGVYSPAQAGMAILLLADAVVNRTTIFERR